MKLFTPWLYKYLLANLLILYGFSVSLMGKEPLLLSRDWVVFGPLLSQQALLTNSEIAQISGIPAQITVAGKKLVGRKVKDSNNIDLVKLFYPGKEEYYARSYWGSYSYLMTEIICSSDSEYYIGTGADWWMKWYIDGKQVFSTFKTGNLFHDFSCEDYAFKVRLSKGHHLVTVIVKSGSSEWKFAATFDQSKREKLKRLEQMRVLAGSAQAYVRKVKQDNSRKIAGMKLVIFGSSVAKGTGAKKNYGWANRLKAFLEKKNWIVINKSIGGNNTIDLLARFKRDLLQEKPDVVIIGLSMANEGLIRNPEKVYGQYVSNMKKLIQLCRKYNIIPMVSNCYPHGSYTQEHYNYIRKFNEELNSWPVVSFDFLGTVDDGNGRWVKGFQHDSGHPNDAGHDEMFHSIPTGIFDNLISQSYFFSSSDAGFMRVRKGPHSGISFFPGLPPYSFSMLFRIKITDADAQGTIAGVSGNNIAVNKQGFWELKTADGSTIATRVKADLGKEFFIALTYSHARKLLILYIDGKNVGYVSGDKLSPEVFYLGGYRDMPSPQADFRNFMIYRSCLSVENVEALYSGRILHSSLELYAPLSDKIVFKGARLINYAQTGEHCTIENVP